MTEKPRCDACTFYEGPPKSDEKGVGGGRSVQSEYKTAPGPTVYRRNLGICLGAPPYSRTGGDQWPEVKAAMTGAGCSVSAPDRWGFWGGG